MKVVAENKKITMADTILKEKQDSENKKKKNLCVICGLNLAETGISLYFFRF
jgi:hypothetical protein